MRVHKPIAQEVNKALQAFTGKNLTSSFAGSVTSMAAESFDSAQLHDRIVDSSKDASSIIQEAKSVLQGIEDAGMVYDSSLSAAEESIKSAMLLNAAFKSRGKEGLAEMGNSLFATGSKDTLTAGLPSSFSMEGFDIINDEKSIIYSAVYNYQATKQAQWAELFFPLLVLNAEDTHFNWEITIDYLNDEYQYPTNGGIAQRNLVPFVELIYDKTRINATHTQLYPVWSNQQGADTSVHFVDAAVYAPTPHPNEPTMLTSYVKPGARYSIINLGTSGLPNIGTVNNTDQLDQNLLIESVLVQLTRTGATDVTVLEVPIEATPRSLFMKNPNGSEDSLLLNYRNEEIILTAGTMLADGTTLLGDSDVVGAYLTNGQYMRIGFTATGDSHIDTGDTEVNMSAERKYGLYSANKALMQTVPVEYTDTVVKVIGYKTNARLSNSNMRTIGQQAMSKTYSRKIGVGTQSGFSSFLNEQIAGQNRRAEQLAKLIEATKIVVEKEQIAKLKEWAQKLDFYKKYITTDQNDEFRGNYFEGLAHFLLEPYYAKLTMKVPDLIQNNQSLDKVQDIQAAMYQYLADAIMKAGIDSRFVGVRDYMMNGVSNSGFQVSIVTDPYTHNFLMRDGEPRLFGETIGEAKITYSNDLTFTNKIYIALTDKAAEPGALLGRGFTLWKPEVVYDRPVSRLGAHHELLITQPRYAIVNNMPILIEVDVQELAAVLRAAVPFKTTNVSVGNQ